MGRTPGILLAAMFLAGSHAAVATETAPAERSRWSLRALTDWFVAQAKPALQAAAQPAPAVPQQAEVPPPPRFDIERFDVQGNTLLTERQVEEALGRYTGKSKDFADVQRALESLQLAYQERGYGSVQVVLPEQELERGVILLRVLEPRLGKIAIEGNQYFDQANIRRGLPSLRQGATPNALEIGRDVRLVNENAAKRATVTLRPSATEGEIDATIRVQDERPWRAAVSFDNSGTPTTGMHRLGLAYQHSNLFNLDNTVTIQYQLDPEPLRDFDKLKVLGIGYRIPLYELNSSLDLLFGYSSLGQASGQVIQGVNFNIAGGGTIVGVRYNYMLPRPAFIAEYDHKISAGLDYKSFSSEVRTVTGGVESDSLTPDVTVHPASLTYSATKRMENSELAFFASVARNIYAHGSDASSRSISGPPGIGARPFVGRTYYKIWRYGLNYARVFPHDIQLRANFTGQWTRDALIPGEQFGIGGWDSLRGLHEREGANDRGYRGSIEVYSPDIASHFALDGGRLRLLGFYDFGRVRRNRALAGECDTPTACGFSAASIGFGVRMFLRQGISLRLDYGRLIDGGVTNDRNEDRWHFGVAVTF